QSLAKALLTARDLTSKEVKKRRLTRRKAEARLGFISPTTDWTGFRHCDFVIEAVVEKLEIKKEVFRELSRRVRPDCILATNTSALSITQISQAAEQPGRVVGMHFFNPVHKMPLVEIIQGKETSPSAVATATTLALAIGKTPIVVQDRPGFLVNRI